MTTLVSGAAGFVGAAACAALSRAGHEVHALVRPGTSDLAAHGCSPSELHRVDLHDTSTLADCRGEASARATVAHAAAAAGPRRWWPGAAVARHSAGDGLAAGRDWTPLRPARSSTWRARPSTHRRSAPLREDDPRPPESAAWRGEGCCVAGRAGVGAHPWSGGHRAAASSACTAPDEPEGRLVPAILQALEDGTPVPCRRGRWDATGCTSTTWPCLCARGGRRCLARGC